jgi:hypothetical protein
MTFTNFEENVLITLYQEYIHYRQNNVLFFSSVCTKYGLEFRPGWLLEAQRNLRAQGYISGPSNGFNDDMAAGKIAALGMMHIEKKYGSKNGVSIIINPKDQSINELPEGISRASGNVYVVDRDPPANFGREGDIFIEYNPEQALSIDSSKWTGLPSNYKLAEESRIRLTADLDKLTDILSVLDLGQETYSQVRAYVIAAKALAEAPEPQADLIWEIINRANQVAGIASLFVSILALFAK